MATLIAPGGENNWFISSGGLSLSSPGVESDPYWANVELLLGFDTSVTGDSSGTPTTASSTTGSITRVTDPVRFGTHSGSFNSGYITYNSKSLAPGTQDFTMEAFIQIPASSTGLYGAWGGFNTNVEVFPASASTDIRVSISSVPNPYTVSMSFNTWYHLAIARQGSTFRTFLDGILIGASSSTYNANFDLLNIGANTAGQNALIGFLDEFRYTRGIARYTANFSPPTSAFPRG